MNAKEKMKRLRRAIDAFESLKSVETARHAELLSRKAAATHSVVDLDAINPDKSISWHLFPSEWLTFRANLDKEISRLSAKAEAASSEMKRMDKVKERLGAKLNDIAAAHEEKMLAEDMTERIANSMRNHKSGLGKFADLIDISRKV